MSGTFSFGKMSCFLSVCYICATNVYYSRQEIFLGDIYCFGVVSCLSDPVDLYVP